MLRRRSPSGSNASQGEWFRAVPQFLTHRTERLWDLFWRASPIERQDDQDC